MAESGVKYHIPRRELCKREIHRLIVSEGLSNAQLSERLKIPRRSIDRYISEIFRDDNYILMHPTEQVIATQLAIFGERLSRQYQNVLAMAMDSSIDASDRLAAHELATDMAYALANMASKVPAIVARQMPVDLTRRISKVPAYLPSSPQQQQPPKLIEVKPVKETDLNNNNNE